MVLDRMDGSAHEQCQNYILLTSSGDDKKQLELKDLYSICKRNNHSYYMYTIVFYYNKVIILCILLNIH